MMGKGEEASGGRKRTSTLADAFESLAGAIYLDSDVDEASNFLLFACQADIIAVGRNPEDDMNPKGKLQEILQAYSTQSPTYSIVSQEGPDHCKVFESKVEWQQKSLGYGVGNSKKEAEIEAARSALKSKVLKKLTSVEPSTVDCE